MIAFEVKDMTCGHCASTITKAVKEADRDATVEIDLDKHLVQIQSGASDAQKLSDVITEAGYTPVPVQSGAGQAAPASSGGCCCG